MKQADYAQWAREEVRRSKRWRANEGYEDEWKRYIDLYRGRQWGSKSKNDQLIVNLIFSTINTIAPSAWCEIDLRYVTAAQRDEMVGKIKAIVETPEVAGTSAVLTIKGEFKSESQEKDEKRNWHRQERRYGSFSRQVTLPAGVNTDACQADFENGVLTLKLPKAEEAKVKRVQITSKS